MFIHLRLRTTGLTREATYHLILLIFSMCRAVPKQARRRAIAINIFRFLN